METYSIQGKQMVLFPWEHLTSKQKIKIANTVYGGTGVVLNGACGDIEGSTLVECTTFDKERKLFQFTTNNRTYKTCNIKELDVVCHWIPYSNKKPFQTTNTNRTTNNHVNENIFEKAIRWLMS